MEATTPMKAIRLHCLECSSGSPQEVRECYITKCPLYSYRFGKRLSTVKRHDEKLKNAKCGDLPQMETAETKGEEQ